MAEDEGLIDWRFADDDLWDIEEDLRAEIAAGRHVDMKFLEALQVEIAAREWSPARAGPPPATHSEP